MLKLSVIIPVYNVEKYVQACLVSVAKQDVDDMEVLVVDDGSTDSSGNICDDFAATDPRFRVIHQNNCGVGSARNHAIEQATGDYVMFVDSDDFLVPSTLGSLLRIAYEQRLDVLGFKYVSVTDDAEPQKLKEMSPSADIEVLDGVEFISKQNFTTMVWWYIARTDIVKRVPFPVGRKLEDAGYNLQVFLKAKRIATVPNVVYCYRNRPTSIMRSTDKAHLAKILDDYLWAAINVDKVIEDNKSVLQGESLKRSKSERNSYVFFGAIRALKIGQVSQFIDKAKNMGLYPFERMSHLDFPEFKYTLMHRAMQIPWLWNLLSKFYLLLT